MLLLLFWGFFFLEQGQCVLTYVLFLVPPVTECSLGQIDTPASAVGIRPMLDDLDFVSLSHLVWEH